MRGARALPRLQRRPRLLGGVAWPGFLSGAME
jgi:hypothetical protein